MVILFFLFADDENFTELRSNIAINPPNLKTFQSAVYQKIAGRNKDVNFFSLIGYVRRKLLFFYNDFLFFSRTRRRFR